MQRHQLRLTSPEGRCFHQTGQRPISSALTSTVGTLNSSYNYYCNGFFVRIALIIGAIQKTVPWSPQAIATSTAVLCLSLSLIGWNTSRTLNLRHNAARGILASKRQQCIQDRDRLLQMRMQLSEQGKKALLETPVGERLTKVNLHGHNEDISKNLHQAIRSSRDQPLIQANTSSAHF